MATFLSFVVYSQQCAHNAELEKAFEQNPSLKDQFDASQAEFEVFYQEFLQNYDPYERSSYTIPVVFHIVYENESENISDEKIMIALNEMNEDFSATHPDLGDVIPEFSGIIGNPDIEFKLATKDNNGNCHPGITRTYVAGGGQHDVGDNSQVRALIESEHGYWPTNKYLNIIVVKSFTSSGNGVTLGYTNYPFGSGSNMAGSIYMAHNAVGSDNTSYIHALSHEVGHWLNLKHTWGNGNTPGDPGNCANGDGVSDTPKTEGAFGCNTNQVTCDANLDNVQNIMDYSYCKKMFTQGQAARMIAALNNNDGGRNNIWQTSNLNATGVLTPAPLCEVEFSSDYTVICAGQTVTFTDDSYHSVSSRNWTFDGGTPSTSTSSNPTITYDTPGVYDVTLQASDGTNSDTKTSQNYIVVMGDPGTPVPYHEGFEGISAIPDNDLWHVVDGDGNGTWDLTNSGGAGGTFHSARLENFGNYNGSFDELISGSIDLSTVDSADALHFSFKYAYRKQDVSNDEWLKVYVSKDCGETWSLRKVIHGNSLSSVAESGYYVAGPPSDWTLVELNNINYQYYVSDFRFKFEFENDGGNNIYIDNINIYGSSMTDIHDVKSDFEEISVYPNPTMDIVNIQFNAIPGEDYVITLHNALGQEIDLIHQGTLNSGFNQLKYNTADLSKGVYIVRIQHNGRLQSSKLIKE